MVVKVKFPLEMENGKKVRNLEELKDNFNLRKIVEHYLDGKLQRWLGANYYDELLEQVESLNETDAELAGKLAGIFGVKSEESKSFDVNSLERSVKLKEELRECGESKEALENVEIVADTQERLEVLVRCGKHTIYLFKGEFCVKKEFRDLKLIGIGRPTVELEAESQEEFIKQNVELLNVDYKRIEKEETKKQSSKTQKSWYDTPLDDFMKSYRQDNLDSMLLLPVSNNISADVEETQKYYFMLRKQAERYIVSVDINDWKVEVVKELGEANISRFGIAYDTFVWVLEENEKIIFWENFRTGKSGKILLDFDLGYIDNEFLVLEDGIIVRKHNFELFAPTPFVKFGFDKSVKEINDELENNVGIRKTVHGCLLDGGNKIWCIDISSSDGHIYFINKNLEGGFQEVQHSCSSCRDLDSYEQTESLKFCEVGIDNGEPFGYSFYEKYASKGWFDTSKAHVNEKFTLKGFERKRGHRVVKFGEDYDDFLIRDFTTEHYQLLGEDIYTKDEGEYLNRVCRFPKMLNSVQGVSIYSKDIFIGVSCIEESDETAIIKIDMQKEREAVILPLEIPAKGKGR